MPTVSAANKQKKEVDNVQYMTRYSSGAECKSSYCIGMNYKEHYHCVDCKSKVRALCVIDLVPVGLQARQQSLQWCLRFSQLFAMQIIVKREEMSRHYKWHKKRDDSLQHGFMRYSPFDDCMAKFGPCAHNKKQTHYHCVQVCPFHLLMCFTLFFSR